MPRATGRRRQALGIFFPCLPFGNGKGLRSRPGAPVEAQGDRGGWRGRVAGPAGVRVQADAAERDTGRCPARLPAAQRPDAHVVPVRAERPDAHVVPVRAEAPPDRPELPALRRRRLGWKTVVAAGDGRAEPVPSGRFGDLGVVDDSLAFGEVEETGVAAAERLRRGARGSFLRFCAPGSRGPCAHAWPTGRRCGSLRAGRPCRHGCRTARPSRIDAKRRAQSPGAACSSVTSSGSASVARTSTSSKRSRSRRSPPGRASAAA